MAQQPDATAALLQQALMAQQQQAANPNVNFQMQQMGQRQNLNQGAGVTAAIQQVNLSTILNQQLQQNQNQHQHQAGGSAANTPIDLHALMATLQQNNVNVGVAGVQRQHQAQPQTQQQHQLGGHAGVVQLENVSTAQLASSLMGNPNFTQVLNLHQQPQSMSNVGIPAVAAGPPGSAPSNVLRVLQLQQQKQQQQYHQQILSQNQQLPPGFGLSQQQSHQQIQQAAQMAQIALTAAAQTSPNAGSLPTPPSSAQALPNMPATTTVPAPQPASVGVISSPYSTFRTSPVESEHGCPHLYQLFIQSAPVHAGSAPGTKRSRKQDLMDDYASLVRFSLAWKYRSELRSGIEARGSFSSSGGLAPSAKRKRGDPEAVADAEEKASLAKVEKMLDKVGCWKLRTTSQFYPFLIRYFQTTHSSKSRRAQRAALRFRGFMPVWNVPLLAAGLPRNTATRTFALTWNTLDTLLPWTSPTTRSTADNAVTMSTTLSWNASWRLNACRWPNRWRFCFSPPRMPAHRRPLNRRPRFLPRLRAQR